jgi:GntR family transcriptional regulator/MocR family aminotransferase
VLPEELLQVRRRDAREHDGATVKRRRKLSAYGRRARAVPGDTYRAIRAFRANQPALDLFPMTIWAQIMARRARMASSRLLVGCEPTGYAPLQEAIAEYLRTSRGVKCSHEQIVIVSGSLEALDLAARVFLSAGDRVCMENPGYDGATRVFEAYGVTICSMPVDAEGAVPPPPSVQDVRLAYLTPAHQFPLGVNMSISRRLAFLDWARRSGALIFEDDYDSEYRYSGRPVPALQGLDSHGSVLFAGTFSKVLFPSLRLAYLVSPPDLVDRFYAAKSLSSRHAPVLEQAVLCDFITEGHFARHIRRMREVYAERLSILWDSCAQRLTGLMDVSRVEAGLQTVGWLRAEIDATDASKAAALRGVEITPLNSYFRGRVTRQGVHLGFAAVDAVEIRRGVRELERALATLP